MGTTGVALDLDRLEALAAAATEGPWRAGLNGGIALVVSRDFGPGRLPRQFRADCGHFDQDRADAAFIAEARTAVPALIADVRRLRALVEQQGAEVIETRGALVAVQREIGALAEELEARPVDVPEAVADEIARRLRALVEGE